MKFFSKLLGKGSDAAERLAEKYAAVLEEWGMSPSEARQQIKEMIKKAQNDSRKEGSEKLPPGFGDSLLERESSSEEIATMLAMKRSEGVRDEDIRWWWNMNDLERRILILLDDLYRFYQFSRGREQGLGTHEAGANVRKFFPVFGDPANTSHTTGDDRPLPYELKQRISVYIQKKQFDSEDFKAQLNRSSSCNALLRKELLKNEVKGQVEVNQAKALIREAQGRYQRLPLGPTSQYLYLAYRERYGWVASDFETFCASLVAHSTAKNTTQAMLTKEFERINGYLDGLLGTYGEIGIKWKLSDTFSISKVDTTIKDKADRELFKTALVADNIASVWAFAVGYNARKRFGSSPTPPEGQETELTQAEVDARLKALAMEER